MPIQLPPPKPYEYALLSQASYSDTPPLADSLLSQKGWERIEPMVADRHGYRASLWVHHARRQLVLAHRGSKNGDSWVTDAESIRNLTVGHFVEQATYLLKHETIQRLKEEGYRFSATGHSLGGFLAQLSVYWSQRSEFKETYYPEMSAVVFDSPGAVDFLETLQSNAHREKERVKIEHLNIQNFCAMPTIISTYGTPTGTTWHLSADLSHVTLDSINAHRLEHILAGFNSETGQPHVFRLMRDWPQADYSAYDSLSKLLSHGLEVGVKLPFDILNSVYKSLARPFGYHRKKTWYEQVCSKKEGELTTYLRETDSNRFPPIEALQNDLTLALKAHYVALNQEDSLKTIDIHHFDPIVQDFLMILWESKPWSKDLSDALQMQYGDGASLLHVFQFVRQGNITEIHLDHYPGTVFDFQADLQQLLHDKGFFSVRDFLTDKEAVLQNRISDLEEELSDLKEGSKTALKKQVEIDELKKDITQIQAQLTMTPVPLYENIFNVRTAIANVPGTLAVNELSEKAYDAERHRELLELIKTAKPGQQFNLDGAVANADRATAIVTSEKGISQGTADLLMRLSALQYQGKAGAATASSSGKQKKNEVVQPVKKETRKPNY